ncbi:MAG: hypothetical protein HY360_06685 [Verrucomicrobia bacterium]|nr:hypothetical protein [Verrucomicrobiota bacterium]
MRVTTNTFPTQLVSQLQKLQERQLNAQRSLSSGQRIHAPSDAPADFRRSIEIQSSQRTARQYQDAIRQTQSRSQDNYDAVTQAQTLVSKASELAIRGNSSLNQSDLNFIATEVNGVLERAVTLGNREKDGRFLFGGTYLLAGDIDPVTGQAYVPFSPTRDPVTGEVTNVTYRGNTKINQVEIESGSNVDTNIIGSSAGNPPGLFVNGATDIFQTLIDLRDNLRAGTPNPGASVSALRNVEDNVAIFIGSVGANMSRLQLANDNHTRSLQTDEETLGKLSGADLVDTAVALQTTDTALQGALQAGARILNQSLLDFLR